MRAVALVSIALLAACGLPGPPGESCHDDGTGTCVEAGCASGYHDGGDGACVPLGRCSTPGYHDCGDGACCLAGTCASGFHPDGAGTCVPQ